MQWAGTAARSRKKKRAACRSRAASIDAWMKARSPERERRGPHSGARPGETTMRLRRLLERRGKGQAEVRRGQELTANTASSSADEGRAAEGKPIVSDFWLARLSPLEEASYWA
jgi:hypothetical protein